MEDIVKRFIEGEDIDNQVCELIKSNQWKEFHKELKKQIINKGKKYYYYLITFTLKPEINKEEYNKIEKFIKAQVLRPALKIKKAEIVKEYTKNKIPHWHVAVKSEKYIAKNRFNYYQNKFGYVDISKTTTNTIDESLNYINKEEESIKLI